MKNRLRTVRAALLLAALLGVSNAAATTVATLQDLVNGGQITVGDKVFYGFHNVTQVGDLTVPMNEIFVDPIVGGLGAPETEPGLRFSSSLWTLAGANLHYDLGFDFNVRTSDGVARITDNTLEFSGDFVSAGRAQVSEGVLDHGTGATLQHKLVFFDSAGSRLQDHEVFPGGPYTELEISKDFSMSTGAAADSRVFVSHIDQTFSQVPDGGPGWAGLAAFGAIALVGRAASRRISC